MTKLQTWWLSICDPKKPEGSQFLGIIIADGMDFMDVHFNINLLQINPGGEIMGFDVTKIANFIDPSFKNKLLSKEEVELLEKSISKLMEDAERNNIGVSGKCGG